MVSGEAKKTVWRVFQMAKQLTTPQTASIIRKGQTNGQLAINFTVVGKVLTPDDIAAIPESERGALTGEVLRLSSIVRHPNELMKRRIDFTVVERRIFFLVLRELKHLQQMNPDAIIPYNEITFAIHPSQLMDFKVSGSFSKIVKGIIRRSLEWDDSQGHTAEAIIFPFATYSNSHINLQLNHKLLPLFLDLSRGYTDYEIDFVLALTSEPAQILYPDFCRLLAFKQEWRISVDELRETLCVKPDSYPQIADFNRYVLDVAMRQINELTDITVEYTPIRSGRKITGYVFSFARKLSETNNGVLVGVGVVDRLEELKAKIRGEVEQILQRDVSELLPLASEILIKQYPTFTTQQREAILFNKDLLFSFIRNDSYASQMPNIKDRQAYVAEGVFGYKKARKRRA